MTRFGTDPSTSRRGAPTRRVRGSRLLLVGPNGRYRTRTRPTGNRRARGFPHRLVRTGRREANQHPAVRTVHHGERGSSWEVAHRQGAPVNRERGVPAALAHRPAGPVVLGVGNVLEHGSLLCLLSSPRKSDGSAVARRAVCRGWSVVRPPYARVPFVVGQIVRSFELREVPREFGEFVLSERVVVWRHCYVSAAGKLVGVGCGNRD